MKHYSYSILTLLLLLLAACQPKQKTTAEIFNEEQSGVCLVLNAYYYEIHLPNNKVWYCTGIDEDGNLQNFTLDKNVALKNRAMLTGTAFFINQDGELLTNRHVADPLAHQRSQMEKAIENQFHIVAQAIENAKDNLRQKFAALEKDKANCTHTFLLFFTRTDHEALNKIEEEQKGLSNYFDELNEAEKSLQHININDVKIVTESEIGIAYNNTFATTPEDFFENNPCMVIKSSQDEDVDLALIQLKNKVTPPHAYIFNWQNEEPEQGFIAWVKDKWEPKTQQTLDIGSQVSIIGYNAGPTLALTKQGIKSQMTSGQITQLSDDSRLLYSIPALPGSSGSPVIDANGQLIAVNFAQLVGTENFNFGIPLKRVIHFIKEE